MEAIRLAAAANAAGGDASWYVDDDGFVDMQIRTTESTDPLRLAAAISDTVETFGIPQRWDTQGIVEWAQPRLLEGEREPAQKKKKSELFFARLAETGAEVSVWSTPTGWKWGPPGPFEAYTAIAGIRERSRGWAVVPEEQGWSLSVRFVPSERTAPRERNQDPPQEEDPFKEDEE